MFAGLGRAAGQPPCMRRGQDHRPIVSRLLPEWIALTEQVECLGPRSLFDPIDKDMLSVQTFRWAEIADQDVKPFVPAGLQPQETTHDRIGVLHRLGALPG